MWANNSKTARRVTASVGGFGAALVVAGILAAGTASASASPSSTSTTTTSTTTTTTTTTSALPEPTMTRVSLTCNALVESVKNDPGGNLSGSFPTPSGLTVTFIDVSATETRYTIDLTGLAVGTDVGFTFRYSLDAGEIGRAHV